MLSAIYLFTSRWHSVDDTLVVVLATLDVLLAIVVLSGVLALTDTIS